MFHQGRARLPDGAGQVERSEIPDQRSGALPSGGRGSRRVEARHGVPLRVVLDNGMTVVLKELHHVPIVSLQAYLKVGSIHEGKYLGTGISHFIEHVIDDGTQRRTRAEIDNLIEGMGNSSNAYTTKDHVQYYITTSRQYLDVALDVLSDYLTHPTFPPAEVDIQRGVIWNELNGDLDDPNQLLHDLYYETAFREHPVRFPVGGYKELFMELTRQDMVEFYQQHYVPNHLIFVAAGDFKTSEMLEKIRTAFQNFQRRIPPAIELPTEPRQLAHRHAERYMDVELAYLTMGYHTVKADDPDAPALDLIATLLGSGESSRLFHILKNQRQIAYAIQVWSETPRYNGGCFGIDAEVEIEKLEEAEESILEQIERIQSEPVSESELKRAQTIEESEYLFALQIVDEHGMMLGIDELTTGDCLFHEKYLQQIRAVTPEDIQRAARTYFQTENLTIVSIRPDGGTRGPEENEKPTPTPLNPPPDRSGQALLPPKEGKEGTRKRENERRPLTTHHSLPSTVQKYVLPNGIRLLTKWIDSAPVVSIQAMFLGGTRFETEADNGVFYLMSNLLLKGTTHRNGEEIFEAIESKGGSISATSGYKAFGLAVNLLSQDLEYGLELLADVLLNPTFDTAELEKLKEEAIVSIQAEEDDGYALGRRLFLETLFQVHPNRFRPSGSIESIEKLSREKVLDCYQRYCVPNNMVFAVFGEIQPDSAGASCSHGIHAIIQPYFEAFRPNSLSFPKVPIEPPLCNVRKVERNKDLAQAVIFQGYPCIPIQHSDREIVEVLSSLLFGAGHPGGRLYKRLRNEQLVYHVQGYPYLGLDHGYLAICASTAPNQVDFVLKRIDEEILNLQRDGVSDAELRRGQQMCLTSYLIASQTASAQASTAVFEELYGLGYDYSAQYEVKIEAVTKEAIQRAANAYLPLDRRVISIIKP